MMVADPAAFTVKTGVLCYTLLGVVQPVLSQHFFYLKLFCIIQGYTCADT